VADTEIKTVSCTTAESAGAVRLAVGGMVSGVVVIFSQPENKNKPKAKDKANKPIFLNIFSSVF
jgi:hypothetical protein